MSRYPETNPFLTSHSIREDISNALSKIEDTVRRDPCHQDCYDEAKILLQRADGLLYHAITEEQRTDKWLIYRMVVLLE